MASLVKNIAMLYAKDSPASRPLFTICCLQLNKYYAWWYVLFKLGPTASMSKFIFIQWYPIGNVYYNLFPNWVITSMYLFTRRKYKQSLNISIAFNGLRKLLLPKVQQTFVKIHKENCYVQEKWQNINYWELTKYSMESTLESWL